LLDTILFTTFEVIRLASILMQPFSPDLASKILDFMGVQQERTLDYAQITPQTLNRSIAFEVEKKNLIFLKKIETGEE
jgi:methionyl-tRNA synthetase